MKKFKLLTLSGLIVGTTILTPIAMLTSCKENTKKPVYIEYVQSEVNIFDAETTGVIRYTLKDLKSTDLTVSKPTINTSSEGFFGITFDKIEQPDEDGNGYIRFTSNISPTSLKNEYIKISFDIFGKNGKTEWQYHADSVTINRVLSLVYVGDSKEVATNPGLAYAIFPFKFGKTKIPGSLDDIQITPTTTSSGSITVGYDNVLSSLNKTSGEAFIVFKLQTSEKYLAQGDQAQFDVNIKVDKLHINKMFSDFELVYTTGIAGYTNDVSTEPGILGAEYEFTFKQEFQNPQIEVGFIGLAPTQLSSTIDYRLDEAKHNVIYFTVSATSEEDIESSIDTKLYFNLFIKVIDRTTQEVLFLEKFNQMSYTYTSKVRYDGNDKKEIVTSLIGTRTDSVPFVFSLIGDSFSTGDVLTIKVFKTESPSGVEALAEQIATPTSGSSFNVSFFLKPGDTGPIQPDDYCKFNIELTLTRRGDELWTQPINDFSLYYIPG